VTRLCPACDGFGVKRFIENIDSSKISTLTYASRKLPELMHYELLNAKGA